MPLPHVPRFQKQSVFNLSGCRFDAAAALGSEDQQLRGMLPRTALLDMLGLLQDDARTSPRVTSRVPSLSTIKRVSFADHPQAVFMALANLTTR